MPQLHNVTSEVKQLVSTSTGDQNLMHKKFGCTPRNSTIQFLEKRRQAPPQEKHGITAMLKYQLFTYYFTT